MQRDVLNDDFNGFTHKYKYNAVLKDVKICAHNYYNRLHPYQASVMKINRLIKEVMEETGLDELDSAEILRRRLRFQYRDALEDGRIEE